MDPLKAIFEGSTLIATSESNAELSGLESQPHHASCACSSWMLLEHHRGLMIGRLVFAVDSSLLSGASASTYCTYGSVLGSLYNSNFPLPLIPHPPPPTLSAVQDGGPGKYNSIQPDREL